jgi:hypothetical protein
MTAQLSLEDYRRDLVREEMERLGRLDRWDCAICGKRVSQQSAHAGLRVRRARGWDHTRCTQTT